MTVITFPGPTAKRLMEIRGTLSELVMQAIGLNEDADAEPLQLFVEDVAVITAATPAIVCNEAAGDTVRHPPARRYRYVLMLRQVQDVLSFWQTRNERRPTADEACKAVLFFSENDCHLEAVGPRGESGFIWRVRHPRGLMQP